MRVPLLILVLAMTGCASTLAETPAVPAPAATTTPATAPATGERTAAEKEELVKAIENAIRQGYKVVNEDGQTLYCRKELKTGSRVRSNLVCLTEDRLLAERRGAQDFLLSVQRNPNRPRGE
jgi:Na+-transporting methylmalonyl-CoA/oxaloacetate decarboxylase gamma subunit